MQNKLNIKNKADIFEKPSDKDQNNNLNKDKRKSVIQNENFFNALKIFEESVKKNKDYKDEEI